MSPKKHIHIEGAFVFLASLYFYWQLGGGWGMFLLLLLVPDIAMIGYLKDKTVGLALYNLAHNYLFPLLVGMFGYSQGNETVMLIALIWVAHIGMDRTLGYGFKYPTDFKDTHISRL